MLGGVYWDALYIYGLQRMSSLLFSITMPRKSRIDIPGALQHIIVRGIEQSKIFKGWPDRNNFSNRLGKIIQETETRCFAWALLPDHFHLLVKTGNVSIATVMRRLLTGHAAFFNKRHRRYGPLFQNRYKSILCQEDIYFPELVRYIHLNPMRAKIVKNIEALDKYPFSGHRVLMGKVKNDWQDIEGVLKLYDERLWVARRRYRAFVRKGITQGRREDLTGGGLIRSAGGWAAVKAMRKAGKFQKSDERILGNGAFVERVLSDVRDQMEQKYPLVAQGYNLEKITKRVSVLMNLKPSEIREEGKERRRVAARSLLCYWAVRNLGLSMAELSRKFGLTLSGISLCVKRGEKIAQEKDYRFIEF
jgi:REP element-mobilizing transposase RayT